MREDHFRRLENLYVGAPCNQYFRPRIRISEGTAAVELDARPDLHHAAKALHGSNYFKVLDDSAFFATNSLVEDVFVLTASFDLHLLKPVVSGTITGHGRVTYRSERRFLAESEVRDSNGDVVAKGLGSFVKSQIRLTPDIGYR